MLQERLSFVARLAKNRQRRLYERRQGTTTMTYTGDIEVIDHLVNRTPGRNIVAIFLGGGQAGIHQTGVAETIAKDGLAESISAYIGISCGTAAIYGLLGGAVDRTKTIYFEENIDHKLFTISRPHRIFDPDILEEALRGRAIDHKFLKKRRTKFFAAITDADTGAGHIIDVKKQEDPLRTIMAAMNMPIVNAGKTVELHNVHTLDGRRIRRINATDGGLTNPMPLFAAARRLHATDILIVDTMPLGKISKQGELLGYFLDGVLPEGKLKGPIVEHLKHYRERTLAGVPYIKGQRSIMTADGERINILAIHPKRTRVGMFTMNRRLLRNAAAASKEFTNNLFQERRRNHSSRVLAQA